MVCESCEAVHTGDYGSGRFCSSKCARGYSTKVKRNEINAKVSEKLKGHHVTEETKQKQSDNNGKFWKGKKRPYTFRRKVKRNNRVAELSTQLHPTKHCPKCKTVGTVKYYSKLCDGCKVAFIGSYKLCCKFKFNVYEHPTKFDLELLETHGWYSASNRGGNLNGVSRDHMYSVSDGFINKIDPIIIAHPANCRLIIHRINQKKHSKSSITLDELYDRIKEF